MSQRTPARVYGLLVAVLAAATISTAAQAEPVATAKTGEPTAPLFRFGDERPATAVVRDGKTVLTIPPLRGIGKAKIHLVQGRWPERLVLRTEVTALEGFGNRTPYDDVTKRRVGDDLEIEIPAKWYAEQPQAIDITWVDYFR